MPKNSIQENNFPLQSNQILDKRPGFSNSQTKNNKNQTNNLKRIEEEAAR